MSPLHVLIACVALAVSGEDSSCGRRFEYEYDVLRKIHNLEETVREQGTLIKYLINRQADMEPRQDLHKIPRIGTSYVRWGRSVCPSGSDFIYNGFASGSATLYSGAGSNVLCLPSDPTWGVYSDGLTGGTRIWLAQYYFGGNLFSSLHSYTVPCAVCLLNSTDIMMLPGKKECPEHYTNEYHGYLMSSVLFANSSADYICMDGNPESGKYASGQKGAQLGMVQGECGALNCPPYVDGREITCAVCSLSS